MDFALILPVFNHLDFTRMTLEGLSPLLDRVEGAAFHLIVVDDGSTDGTSDWVKAHFPDVILLQGNGDLWWSGAINVGARYAIDKLKVDYLILWNNDIYIDENYFIELISVAGQLSEPAILGSKIYVADQPGLVWSAGGYFNPRSGKNGMYGYFKQDSDELNEVRDVDWLTGMGTIIPRSVVEKIGYWDNLNFPQYHGDTDFTYRAKLAGYPVRIVPSLKLYNNIEHSGIEHRGSFRSLLKLITDIRSKSNFRKNLVFHRKYVKSPLAYLPLIWLYVKIFGGFFKWKLLQLFGIRKQTT